jgi:hypothetical protein
MYDTLAPPGALAILAAICEQNQKSYEFFDFNILLHRTLSESELTELSDWLVGITVDYQGISPGLKQKILDLWIEHIDALEPDSFEFIGISIFSMWSLRMAQLILPWLRSRTSAKIVLGGNGCSSKFFDTKINFSTWIQENNLADFVVVGDGEPTFDAILKGEVCIPGVNQIPQKHDWDINQAPIPNYSKFDLSLYSAKKVYITGSRGCVRDCTFCDIGTIWPKFRYRQSDSLLQEIKKHYYDLGVTEFDFTDSLINGSISNFYRFNCLLAEEKAKNSDLKDISYIGQFICRPQSQMPKSHYEAMYYAGCKQVTIGIESFSESVRYHMRKKFNNKDIDYHIDQSSRWNIKNVWLMICGYPTETLQDHKENLINIEKYSSYSKQGIIELIRWGTTMHLIDDTPITSADMLKDLDIILDTQGSLGFTNTYNWVSSKNPTLDLTERIRRRVEIHEHCVKHGYAQPRVRQELSSLLTLAKQHVMNPKKKIFEIGKV